MITNVQEVLSGFIWIVYNENWTIPLGHQVSLSPPNQFRTLMSLELFKALIIHPLFLSHLLPIKGVAIIRCTLSFSMKIFLHHFYLFSQLIFFFCWPFFFLSGYIFISYIYIYISFSRCYNFKFIFSKYFFDISNISLTFFHSLIPSIPRWTHLQRMIFSSSNHLVSSVQRGAGGIQKGVGGKGNNNVLSYHFQVVIWN